MSEIPLQYTDVELTRIVSFVSSAGQVERAKQLLRVPEFARSAVEADAWRRFSVNAPFSQNATRGSSGPAKPKVSSFAVFEEAIAAFLERNPRYASVVPALASV